MAPDNWHHIEGAYPTARSFRLYVYDDYGRPLPADKLKDVQARVVTKETFDPATRKTTELSRISASHGAQPRLPRSARGRRDAAGGDDGEGPIRKRCRRTSVRLHVRCADTGTRSASVGAAGSEGGPGSHPSRNSRTRNRSTRHDRRYAAHHGRHRERPATQRRGSARSHRAW